MTRKWRPRVCESFDDDPISEKKRTPALALPLPQCISSTVVTSADIVEPALAWLVRLLKVSVNLHSISSGGRNIKDGPS